jgi:hypothetical protein
VTKIELVAGELRVLAPDYRAAIQALPPNLRALRWSDHPARSAGPTLKGALSTLPLLCEALAPARQYFVSLFCRLTFLL